MNRCLYLVCLFLVSQFSIIVAQEQPLSETSETGVSEVEQVIEQKIPSSVVDGFEVVFPNTEAVGNEGVNSEVVNSETATTDINSEVVDTQDGSALLEQSLNELKLTELRPVDFNENSAELRSPNPPNYLLINSPELKLDAISTGELGPGDGQNFRDASYVDIWQFVAEEGEAIEIQVRSEFDSFLSVYSPDGKLYTTNDDALLDGQNNQGFGQTSATQDAALRVRLLQTGRYMVVLSGMGQEAFGLYSILTKKLPVQEGGGLELTQPVYASFGKGDKKDNDLALRFDEFNFALTNSQTLSFDMFVEDYEGRLLLYDSQQKLIADSSIQGSPMIEQLRAGNYTLRAAIFDDASVDKKENQENLKLYKLTVETLELSFQTSISIGDDFLSLLATRDQRVDNRFIDSYKLSVSELTEVIIDLRSQAFDAYLYLYDASGFLVAENDDASSETGTDSQLVLELPAGVYNLVVTSYEDAEKKTGLYNLSIQHPQEENDSSLKLEGTQPLSTNE